MEQTASLKNHKWMVNEYFYLIGRQCCFRQDFDELWLRDLLQKIRYLFFITSVVHCDTYLFVMDDQIEILIEKVNLSTLQVKLGIRKDFLSEGQDNLIALCEKKFHDILDQIQEAKPSAAMSVRAISPKTMNMGSDDLRFYDLEDLKTRYCQGENIVHCKNPLSEDDEMLDDPLSLLLTQQEQQVSFVFIFLLIFYFIFIINSFFQEKYLHHIS